MNFKKVGRMLETPESIPDNRAQVDPIIRIREANSVVTKCSSIQPSRHGYLQRSAEMIRKGNPVVTKCPSKTLFLQSSAEMIIEKRRKAKILGLELNPVDRAPVGVTKVKPRKRKVVQKPSLNPVFKIISTVDPYSSSHHRSSEEMNNKKQRKTVLREKLQVYPRKPAQPVKVDHQGSNVEGISATLLLAIDPTPEPERICSGSKKSEIANQNYDFDEQVHQDSEQMEIKTKHKSNDGDDLSDLQRSMGDKKLHQFSMGRRRKPGVMTLFRSRYGDNPSFLKAVTEQQEAFHLESWLGRVATGIPSLEKLSTPNIRNPNHFLPPNKVPVNKSTDCIRSSWAMENIQKGAIYPSDVAYVLRSVEYPTIREGVSAATLLESEIEMVADSEETETPVLAEMFLEDGPEPVFNTEAAKPVHAATLIENEIEPPFVTESVGHGNAGVFQPGKCEAAVITNLDSTGGPKNNFVFQQAGRNEKRNRRLVLHHAKSRHSKKFDNRLDEHLRKVNGALNAVANKELSPYRRQRPWHYRIRDYRTRFPETESGAIFPSKRCNICRKLFLLKDNLLYTSHVHFHAKEARESLYCLICKIKFEESADFFGHLVSAHMGKNHLGRPISNQYSCYQCPKGTKKFYFVTFDSLVFHVFDYHGKLPGIQQKHY